MDSKELAQRLRIHAIHMAHFARESHVASALSMADIMAVLYSGVLTVFPEDPSNDNRDRFVLSKGHACSVAYAALAETGFFPVGELNTQCQDGSRLAGHITKNVPGVELSTGSLGHGCCVASGIALAGKVANKKYKVYAVMGDGECNEGSVWEMALFANHVGLDNFTVVIDHNKMQAMGDCADVMDLGSLAEKWRAFGWDVLEVDGHNHEELFNAFESPTKGKPKCVIAHTVKGKGVSFMEGNLLWHYRDPQGEEYSNALSELEGERN